MAVQAQYPSNFLLFNRYLPLAHLRLSFHGSASIQFSNGGSVLILTIVLVSEVVSTRERIRISWTTPHSSTRLLASWPPPPMEVSGFCSIILLFVLRSFPSFCIDGFVLGFGLQWMGIRGREGEMRHRIKWCRRRRRWISSRLLRFNLRLSSVSSSCSRKLLLRWSQLASNCPLKTATNPKHSPCPSLLLSFNKISPL